MSDRDKFLTEAVAISSGWLCVCENNHPLGCYVHPSEFQDFSTWQGFGKLWEWAVDQEWFDKFTTWSLDRYYKSHSHEMLFHVFNIHPDRFATAIYNYLKPKETP